MGHYLVDMFPSKEDQERRVKPRAPMTETERKEWRKKLLEGLKKKCGPYLRRS